MGYNGMDRGSRRLSRMENELAYRLVLDESEFDDNCALQDPEWGVVIRSAAMPRRRSFDFWVRVASHGES